MYQKRIMSTGSNMLSHSLHQIWCCRSKRFHRYRNIMQSLKRRLSFRKKKDHVPECSKPHQWQEDEKKVREGTCSFQVRVSADHFPFSLFVWVPLTWLSGGKNLTKTTENKPWRPHHHHPSTTTINLKLYDDEVRRRDLHGCSFYSSRGECKPLSFLILCPSPTDLTKQTPPPPKAKTVMKNKPQICLHPHTPWNLLMFDYSFSSFLNFFVCVCLFVVGKNYAHVHINSLIQ